MYPTPDTTRRVFSSPPWSTAYPPPPCSPVYQPLERCAHFANVTSDAGGMPGAYANSNGGNLLQDGMGLSAGITRRFPSPPASLYANLPASSFLPPPQLLRDPAHAGVNAIAGAAALPRSYPNSFGDAPLQYGMSPTVSKPPGSPPSSTKSYPNPVPLFYPPPNQPLGQPVHPAVHATSGAAGMPSAFAGTNGSIPLQLSTNPIIRSTRPLAPLPTLPSVHPVPFFWLTPPDVTAASNRGSPYPPTYTDNGISLRLGIDPPLDTTRNISPSSAFLHASPTQLFAAPCYPMQLQPTHPGVGIVPSTPGSPEGHVGATGGTRFFIPSFLPPPASSVMSSTWARSMQCGCNMAIGGSALVESPLGSCHTSTSLHPVCRM